MMNRFPRRGRPLQLLLWINYAFRTNCFRRIITMLIDFEQTQNVRVVFVLFFETTFYPAQYERIRKKKTKQRFLSVPPLPLLCVYSN